MGNNKREFIRCRDDKGRVSLMNMAWVRRIHRNYFGIGDAVEDYHGHIFYCADEEQYPCPWGSRYEDSIVTA